MIETDPAVTVRQVTDSRQVRDSGCAEWRARGSDGMLIDRQTGNGFATVGSDESYDDETLLLRVLSDVRRAYCRQPLSGLAVDDSCLPDTNLEARVLPTEFVKQLSDYGRAQQNPSSRSILHSRPADNIIKSSTTTAGHASSPTASWKLTSTAALRTGSAGTSPGRSIREIRLGGQRPRRAASLDRPVSLPPFLRPIEEEDCSTGPGRTPTDYTLSPPLQASPPSSPATSSSDEQGEMTFDVVAEKDGEPPRRYRQQVDDWASKVFTQDVWLSDAPATRTTTIQSGSATRTRRNYRSRRLHATRPVRVCCVPDFSATCFDSDEDCPCTAMRHKRLINRQPAAATAAVVIQPLADDDNNRHTNGRDNDENFRHGQTGSTTSPLDNEQLVGESLADEIRRSISHDDVTLSDRSNSTSETLLPTRLQFYVLMTSVAVFVACWTAASPCSLVSVVALTSLVSYPIAKF